MTCADKRPIVYRIGAVEAGEIVQGVLIEKLVLAVRALEKIANTDYRGNRSVEQTTAYAALKEIGLSDD